MDFLDYSDVSMEVRGTMVRLLEIFHFVKLYNAIVKSTDEKVANQAFTILALIMEYKHIKCFWGQNLVYKA